MLYGYVDVVKLELKPHSCQVDRHALANTERHLLTYIVIPLAVEP